MEEVRDNKDVRHLSDGRLCALVSRQRLQKQQESTQCGKNKKQFSFLMFMTGFLKTLEEKTCKFQFSNSNQPRETPIPTMADIAIVVVRFITKLELDFFYLAYVHLLYFCHPYSPLTPMCNPC